MQKSVLMCPPKYFGVFYKINPWMHPEKEVVDREKAIAQWEELSNIYSELGLKLQTLDQVDGLPDMTFAANGFFNVGKKAIVATYKYPERQGETPYYKNWLKSQGFEVYETPGIAYEGQGDTLMVGSKIFQGWGFRSDPEIAKEFRKHFKNKKTILLHLIDPRFYHLDTCFLPINPDLVLYFAPAFDEKSQEVISKNFKNHIAVTEEEALSFGLNSVVVGNTVIINKKAEKLSKRLQDLGFKTVQTDTSEFQKSGGSVKCLTNEIYT